jgi:hypothetical protein
VLGSGPVVEDVGPVEPAEGEDPVVVVAQTLLGSWQLGITQGCRAGAV